MTNKISSYSVHVKSFNQVRVYFLQDEDPLNSDDDVSDDDPADLFDTDNVVVCQFDKVQRLIHVRRRTGSKVSQVMDWGEEKGSKALQSPSLLLSLLSPLPAIFCSVHSPFSSSKESGPRLSQLRTLSTDSKVTSAL